MAGFVTFRQTGDTGKTAIFQVISAGDAVLGEIKWYPHWRRYCFFPAANTVFDVYCLGQIIEHVDELMAERTIR